MPGSSLDRLRAADGEVFDVAVGIDRAWDMGSQNQIPISLARAKSDLAQRIRGRPGGEARPMFAWLRRRRVLREKQRLERLHLQLLTAARDLQRNGDIQGFAAKTAEAAVVEQQLDRFLAEHGLTAAPSR